jgi:hypothetical protein
MWSGIPMFTKLILAYSKCMGTSHTKFCSDQMKITEVTTKYLWLPSVKHVFRNTDVHEIHTSWFKVYGYISDEIMYGWDENYRWYAKISMTSFGKVCVPEYRFSRNSSKLIQSVWETFIPNYGRTGWKLQKISQNIFDFLQESICSGIPIFTKLIPAESKCMGTFIPNFVRTGWKLQKLRQNIFDLIR